METETHFRCCLAQGVVHLYRTRMIFEIFFRDSPLQIQIYSTSKKRLEQFWRYRRPFWRDLARQPRRQWIIQRFFSGTQTHHKGILMIFISRKLQLDFLGAAKQSLSDPRISNECPIPALAANSGMPRPGIHTVEVNNDQ